MDEPTLRVGLASSRERAAISLRGKFRLGETELPVRVVDGPVGVIAMGIGERELRNP